MTWSATFVSADPSIPPEGFSWSDTRELSRKVGADYIDLLTLRHDKLQVAVDDTGLLDGKPLNQRVTRLVNDMGYPGMIAGDAVIIGVTAQGNEADSPIAPDDARLRA